MEGIFSKFEALIGRLERRSKLQLQLQQLDPNDPERQEVAAKLLGLRAETAAGWNAAVDWTARYAGVLQALTAAQDGAIFEALTEPDAKKMMKKLRLLVRWEVTRRMVQKRVDSSERSLLACCGIAPYSEPLWISLTVAIGTAVCGGLAEYYSTDSTTARVLSLVAIIGTCTAAAAGVVHWLLAPGLALRKADIDQLERYEQEARKLAAELQGPQGLLRFRQLVLAIQAELHSTFEQAELAFDHALFRRYGGGGLPPAPAP